MTVEVKSIDVADSTTLEPGTYFFIDPCYVFSNDNPEHDAAWSAFCDKMFGGSEEFSEGIVTFVVDGVEHKVLFAGTAYGDGTYPAYSLAGLVSRNVGVDAGMLSIVPLAFVEAMDALGDAQSLGMKFTLIEPTLAGVEKHNWYGAVECRTDDDDEDEFDNEDGDYMTEEDEGDDQ